MADTRTITQICTDTLDHPELLAGCNLFVQSVLGSLGYGDLFTKGDDADAMVAAFAKAPFHLIGKNPGEAMKRAGEGKLVVAGMTKAAMSYVTKQGDKVQASMGHVVIVLPGGPSKPGSVTLANGVVQPNRGGYPLSCGGAAMARYRIKSVLSIDVVFPSKVLNDVVYAYLDLPAAQR